MQFNPIKVLVVDQSRRLREKLQAAMKKDSAIELLQLSGGLSRTRQSIAQGAPGVLILNTVGDGLDIISFLKDLRSYSDIPVITIAERSADTGYINQFKNVDFIKIPDSHKENDISSFCNEICVKIKISAQSKLKSKPAATVVQTRRENSLPYHIIAIGASTGGTEATAEIMKRLPAEVPGIVIVQHMPAGFTQMYAERLNRISKLKVSEAKNGDRVSKGTALVAAGGKHMVLKKDSEGYYVRCMEGERVNGHCPSVGVLFDSVARAAGKEAIGVILTGMGKDGAKELLNMRRAGAYTIGQDNASSVVYGMPMVAYEIGAVAKQAPCDKIAEIILKQLR